MGHIFSSAFWLVLSLPLAWHWLQCERRYARKLFSVICFFCSQIEGAFEVQISEKEFGITEVATSTIRHTEWFLPPHFFARSFIFRVPVCHFLQLVASTFSLFGFLESSPLCLRPVLIQQQWISTRCLINCWGSPCVKDWWYQWLVCLRNTTL